MKSRAIVIGGSLGGLFAANLLVELGWEVDVFERVPDDLASRGAGIGTHEELVAMLAKLGIGMDERLGTKAGDRVCVDRAGNELYRMTWGHTMSAWANVYRPLKDRFPAERYHFGKSFLKFERDNSETVARFEDGSEARADLLIGADGLRSAVRAQLFPGLEPAYAGYVAWRSIVCCQVPAKDPARARGRLDWNWVWYRPVTQEALRDLNTDASGRHRAGGIPPPLRRPDVIAKMKSDAKALLAPHMAEVFERSQPFFQAIFDVESPRMAVGRACLLGDAAFVARPHVGMGVTKAALDALCLARSITKSPGDVETALERYDRLRDEFGRRCIARARRLGSYIEARARPERLLHEVAASLSEIPELALEI
jgi:2-polyprenyl-6-methoxyphenol hydroxylase-like FAD-dependent oxidoreductase